MRSPVRSSRPRNHRSRWPSGVRHLAVLLREQDARASFNLSHPSHVFVCRGGNRLAVRHYRVDA